MVSPNIILRSCFRLLFGGTLALFLAGCNGLTTTASPESAGLAKRPRVGNYYFLPHGVIQLDCTLISKEANEFQVSVKTLNVPEKKQRYFLKHKANPFYEDDLQIKINGKGLLETVNLSTEDKTPAIIDKITDTFVDVARIAASGYFNTAKEVPTAITLKPFHVIFDPFDSAQRTAAATKLRDCGFNLKFPNPATAIAHVASDGKSTTFTRRTAESFSEESPAGEMAGVFYHPPTAMELEISTLDNSQTGLLQHVWVRLPSPTEIAVMDATRSFLIKKKNNYALVDGDLIQIDHNRPSQVLGLVSVPASVVHKVAEAIPTLIAIEDKRATRVSPELAAQKSQLDAQTAVLNARISLLEAQQKLQNAQGPGKPLTREALQEQAVAEKEEASARTEKARAEKEEALSRATRSRETRGQPPPASPTPAEP